MRLVLKLVSLSETGRRERRVLNRTTNIYLIYFFIANSNVASEIIQANFQNSSKTNIYVFFVAVRKLWNP